MIARFGQFHRDARILLATTLVTGAALSLYWIDFNLYLASLGHSSATIGVIATVGSLAGALAAFPASAVSDRIGRRAVMLGGIGIALVALVALLLFEAVWAIAVAAALWSIGQQSLQVVQAPYMAEHSEPDHRNELFALQAALFSVTSVIAAALGGVVATALGSQLGFEPGSPGVYRIILVIMTVLLVVGLGTVGLLRNDRPQHGPATGSHAGPRLGVSATHRVLFVRLLLPGFLIATGAGQVIPFLNLFVQSRFGLDLAELNALFAVTSLGTVVALLAQPALARRFGQITSVVMVQGASIPFLVVLGFSPVLWTVVAAMVVRNSLMNAGNPIFSAFAMERVTPEERATLAAAMSVTWQIGWVIGGAWYAALQATVGFDAGYTVNFITIVALYSIATSLYWIWFRADERRVRAEAPAVS